MIPVLLTRPQLEIINRRTLKYPLQTSEKDYFLAVVLQIISESNTGSKIVFKGGTAIYHCYLDQYRFSEDLDFSSTEPGISLQDVRIIFDGFSFLTIKKDFTSNATIKIEKLQYTGPLQHLNTLKVEIDRLQNVLLPPQSMKYNNVWGLNFKIKVMDIREIGAEKIRAMSDRARYRDFYDLYWIIEKYKLDLPEIISYIPQKEIRQPITKDNIIRNWSVVETQRVTEMGQTFYSQKVDNEVIKDLIDNLPFTK
jgi:predicted nucleotidyltransferase component of viral defense system